MENDVSDPDWPESVENYHLTMSLLQCLQKKTQIEIVDTYPYLRDVWQKEPERYRSFYGGHMTPDGNRVVASILDKYLSHSGKS